MTLTMEFVKKLLRNGIILEIENDYELSQEFLERFNRQSEATGDRRQTIITVLVDFETDLTEEELSRACLFIENFMEE